MKPQSIRSLFYFFLGITILCTNCSKKPEQLASSKLQQQMMGAWDGIVPCTDCAGLDLTYSLYPDHTYSLKKEHLAISNPSPQPEFDKGKWLLTADSVLHLTNSNDSSVSLKYDGNILVNTTEKNKLPKTAEENYYLFNKVDIRKAWSRLASVGCRFVAYGTQPEWELKILDNESVLFSVEGKFLSSGRSSIVTKLKDSPDEFIINSASDKNQIKIIATRKAHNDSINNYDFTWTVAVSMNEKDGNQLVEYIGGGKYLYEFYLAGKWQLSSIDNSPVDNRIFPPDKLRPYIQIEPIATDFSGFTGCKDFNGKYKADMDSVTFDKFLSDQKDCPNIKFEQQLIKKLSGNKFKWEIASKTMSLKSEKSELKFIKQ